jgi:hypothetical protein
MDSIRFARLGSIERENIGSHFARSRAHGGAVSTGSSLARGTFRFIGLPNRRASTPGTPPNWRRRVSGLNAAEEAGGHGRIRLLLGSRGKTRGGMSTRCLDLKDLTLEAAFGRYGESGRYSSDKA